MPPDPFFDRALTRRAFLGRRPRGGRRARVVGGVARPTAGDGCAGPEDLLPARALERPVRVRPAAAARVRARSHRRRKGISSRAAPRSRCAFRGPGGSWTPLTRARATTGSGCRRGVASTSSRPSLDTAGVWKVEAQVAGQKVPVRDPGERSARRPSCRAWLRRAPRHPRPPTRSASTRSAPASRCARCTRSRCRR